VFFAVLRKWIRGLIASLISVVEEEAEEI